MSLADLAQSWWSLVCKDLLREYRAPRVWPGMLLLGVVLAMMIGIQVDLPREQKTGLMAGLFWLAAFFAGTLALDRSFSGEREEGCWQALALYPLAPATLFLAKMTVNFAALCCLDCVLAPAFIVFSDAPLRACPWALLTILLLGNLGFAAVGTLLSALTNGLQQRSSLLVLLLLPLLSPVVLAAAQATRSLVAEEAPDAWWRSAQLLAVFAAVFVLVGAMVFEFLIED